MPFLTPALAKLQTGVVYLHHGNRCVLLKNTFALVYDNCNSCSFLAAKPLFFMNFFSYIETNSVTAEPKGYIVENFL